MIFLLHSEHIGTPSNFTLVAHPSATSEGSLHRSDGDFPEQMCQVASTGLSVSCHVLPCALTHITSTPDDLWYPVVKLVHQGYKLFDIVELQEASVEQENLLPPLTAPLLAKLAIGYQNRAHPHLC